MLIKEAVIEQLEDTIKVLKRDKRELRSFRMYVGAGMNETFYDFGDRKVTRQ